MEFCIGTHRVDLWSAEARKALREAGAVELSVDDDRLMGDGCTDDDARRLRDLLEADGLRAVTAHPPFGSFNEPFSVLRQDPDGLAEELEWMRRFLHRCGLLGIQAIPLHTGGAMLPRAREWEIACARDYIRALLPAAEAAGVVIAVENTNHATPIGFYPGVRGQVPLNKNIWEFDDSARICDLVHSFDSPFVRICYDTGHSHLLGRMLPDLELFFGDIALFHLHDNDGAGNDAHLQPGYGNAPWGAFFRRVAEMPSTPTLFVEAGPRFGDVRLMLNELRAIAEGRTIVKPGGFLKKDENTGRIVVLTEREGSAC